MKKIHAVNKQSFVLADDKQEALLYSATIYSLHCNGTAIEI